MKEEVRKQIQKHMTPKTVAWIIGTAIYIACFILMIYAPMIAETAAVSFGLGLPALVAIVTFIYAPSDRLKAALVAFSLMMIIVLALTVTGYGVAVIELFVQLAAIIQCLSSLVFIGVPLYGAYRYAKKKGWTAQAEKAADSAVTNFFDQLKENKN